ncbi:MAG: lytic murein transglycosylase [Candidatus Moranbacteria bacterium]|nr:lytic murein transglycosylase [Candidatus Moranbacteria bacterium]
MTQKATTIKITPWAFASFFIGVFLATNVFVAFAEEDVKKLEDKAEKVEEDIKDAQQEVVQKQQELTNIKGALYVTQNEINKTETQIAKTEEEISRTEKEIAELEKNLTFQKTVLQEVLRQIYYSNQEPVVTALFSSHGNLADLWDDADHMGTLKDKTGEVIDDIESKQEQINSRKNELKKIKDDRGELLKKKESQEQSLQAQHAQTQTDLRKKESTLGELNQKLAKIKSDLSELLGESYDAKDIIDAAKFASKKTGVRKDYLLGVLVVESDLGRYTGGCTYKESNMSDYRQKIFKDIAEELDYNYKKLKLSCPPRSYKGTGGAMGVAQFMPDTWLGYKASIAVHTGHNPPDPWSLTDGVMAMALKLAKVDGVTSHKKSAEAKAYCVYLAGGNWANYCDDSGTNYGDLVLYWADNYEKKL